MNRFLETTFEDIKPYFILWTGDNSPHDIWNSTQHKDFKPTKKFTKAIIKTFNSTIPVYPVIGNHDKYPDDLYNSNNSTFEKNFLQELGHIWKHWFDDQAYNTFINFGYYTMKHLNTNLRIVALNSLTCDTFNFWVIENPTDPLHQVKIII